MGFSWGSDAAFDTLECNVLASGDVDVMTTTVAQVMPCLDDIAPLVAATNKRISILPDVPTVSEVLPELDLFLWNGLFVHKDTPANVREKIIPVAKRALQSERAKKLTKEMGVLIYWMDAEASKAQIKKDIATFSKINKMLEK
jgi:tripartite-type tricarboxylate transporter receptor subunit TctC